MLKLNRICLSTFFLLTLNLSAQDDGMPADMGDTGDPCGDVEYPVADPGPDGGCADYADCNGNGVFDLGEPCFEGTANWYCQICDMHFATGEEMDQHAADMGHLDTDMDPGEGGGDYTGEDPDDDSDYAEEGPADDGPPFEDVDTNGDGSIDREEARAFFGDDPNFDEEYDRIAGDDGTVDHAEYMAADDGGEYEEYGDHTVENCIAMAEGHDTYWIGEDEFAVWDDPNVDCGYLLDEIGFMAHPGPPPFDEIDADANGEVDMEEARAWFQEHDPEYDDAEFEEGYNEVDTNNDGVVDPSEHEAAGSEMTEEMDSGDEGAGEPQDGYYCAICDMDFGTAEEMDQHAADMGHTMGGQECDPNAEYPNNPPGPDEGCMAYDDCNGNGAFDIGEPCHDGGDN